MKLNLKRPIVFFDLETTGVDTAKDRIVEISMVKVMPDGEEIVKTRKINPGIHIPEEATAIHGITDEDVKDCPTFAQIARSLEQFIAGCDFGGFNSNRFDLPMLVEEFMRAGIGVDFKRRRFVDVQNIFHKMEQRTLVAAYKFYCGQGPHERPFGRSRYAGDLRGAQSAAGPLRQPGKRHRFPGRILHAQRVGRLRRTHSL